MSESNTVSRFNEEEIEFFKHNYIARARLGENNVNCLDRALRAVHDLRTMKVGVKYSPEEIKEIKAKKAFIGDKSGMDLINEINNEEQ